jgi:glycosyltransferase involved in cell wall biosynthesis
MNINILLFWFGENWSEGRTYQKVAEHLSKISRVNSVVCVFPPRAVKENIWTWPLKINKVGKKLVLFRQNNQAVPAKSWPYRLRVWMNDLATKHTLPVYLRLRGYRQDNTILWLFPPHPYLEELVRKVPHSTFVAHIVDNFTKFKEDRWLCENATAQYPVVHRDADVIITGSELNHRVFSDGRKNCYLFENAADEDFLGEPSNLPCAGGSSPRLGYVGTISQRTDVDLLEWVARKRPEWSFLLAGRQEISLDDHAILNLPNVRYEGIIPYQELPQFIRGLDVCLIPHRKTEYSKSMSPLKLYQYLASGRPIVSTDIEGLGRLKEHVCIGKTYQEFEKSVDHVLREDTIELSRRRIEAAKKETWDKRVQDMFSVVETCFQKKKISREPVLQQIKKNLVD